MMEMRVGNGGETYLQVGCFFDQVGAIFHEFLSVSFGNMRRTWDSVGEAEEAVEEGEPV
jgi:hypothetical protein